MKKTKRLIASRFLHMGCNLMDSIRVGTWMKVLDLGNGLTEKEYRLIRQRFDKVKECTEDVRKIANHIERQAKK